MTKFTRALICCTVLTAGTTYGAQAKPSKINPDMLQTLRALIQMNLEADNVLFGYMETTAKWLSDFTQRAGHFPEGREAGLVEARLASSMTTNPYKPVQIADTNASDPSVESLPEKNLPKVKLLVDHSLMKEHLDDFIASNISNAMEEPGTITALSNGNDLFVVWGAGSDRKTIRDKSGKPRVVVSLLP